MTARRAEVLRLVIHEYVDSATPVGSEALVRKYNLKLSSATIRNEMARLEEEQYITHPHTSAGRIPSDRGYRYFVESLMVDEDLSRDEKATIRHQFYQASREVEDWSELAASILAHATRSLAVVTAPRLPQSRLKHVELLELNDRTVLMVVVLPEARVRQRLLAIDEPVSQEELTEISARLNRFSGLSESEIEASDDFTQIEQTFVSAICDVLRGEDQGRQVETFTDGLENMLAEPEFSSHDRVLNVLQAVDERNLAQVIPFRDLSNDRVLLMIGEENPEDRMRHFSVVISEYGSPETLRGALGIVGPTRMRYPRVISTVRYMAGVMSDLISGIESDNRPAEANEQQGRDE